MNEGAVLQIAGLERTFVQGNRQLRVLSNLDLSVARGEAIALMGPSGSGKSTLLHAAGLLEQPDAGSIVIAGQNCADMNDRQRTAMRRDYLGFVYQFHHLLPEFTALENVLMPLRLANVGAEEAKQRAQSLLIELGLEDRLAHAPAQLSGGEQQRVAIARALANKPVLLLADEPTGNLDQATAEVVLEELLSLVRQQGLAAVIATHDPLVADRLDRTVRLQDGHLVT
ncbi:MAG: ABC transporter ATP-binding protein [Rhodospirillaceae bacterium]|jgi:lipoprotein-releasing system ATP-binding protein|nr:ABC transporter ATP-binding protein [Rhodospirillaceae bacterium]MBT4046530.1 ABC transporter ATP-binding protein [Rhodospirillaceae bacterium]MBT4689865.1 ABC transporter ATP-binding protein [Rhodospirillaceae bacterium]MBT5083700.1 ABC transporter ATP-binding protein [Rhodospirillaceae bacterium]MBT5522576.1 ABC transporter ATP-binding protein [Rhodospirillaceae bacterium]